MASQLTRTSLSVLCRCVRRNHRVPFQIGYSLVSQRRYQSTEAMPIAAPHVDGVEKKYPSHIQHIVDDIGKLTLLEVADLNELLKITLNISDAPMMAMGAMPMAQSQEEEDAPVEQKQTLFTVKLTKFDDTKKVALIKEIKSLLTGMNLVQAKKFVESAPAEVKKDITKEEAETLKKALEAVGGSAEIE